MCWFRKKTRPDEILPGQIDTIKGCDPTQKWLDGIIPSMTIPELIDVLKMRAGIHLTYYTAIVEGKFSPYSGYGDANFQLWAIEGYENAIHYLSSIDQ